MTEGGASVPAFAASPSSPSVSPVPASIPCAVLPWPAYNLSQNGQHGHFRAHEARKKAYHALATEALNAVPVPTFDDGDIRLTVTFHPPTVTRPDLDNALTRLKAGIDALALAWGVNDNRFEYDLRRGAKIKGGRVTIIARDIAS